MSQVAAGLALTAVMGTLLNIALHFVHKERGLVSAVEFLARQVLALIFAVLGVTFAAAVQLSR